VIYYFVGIRQDVLFHISGQGLVEKCRWIKFATGGLLCRDRVAARVSAPPLLVLWGMVLLRAGSKPVRKAGKPQN